eukprot:m.52880 g.52880  ORF g.52880 m.52880 type:complete len:436 (-) comp12337_c1_seq2:1359-2666(-)
MVQHKLNKRRHVVFQDILGLSRPHHALSDTNAHVACCHGVIFRVFADANKHWHHASKQYTMLGWKRAQPIRHSLDSLLLILNRIGSHAVCIVAEGNEAVWHAPQELFENGTDGQNRNLLKVYGKPRVEPLPDLANYPGVGRLAEQARRVWPVTVKPDKHGLQCYGQSFLVYNGAQRQAVQFTVAWPAVAWCCCCNRHALWRAPSRGQVLNHFDEPRSFFLEVKLGLAVLSSITVIPCRRCRSLSLLVLLHSHAKVWGQHLHNKFRALAIAKNKLTLLHVHMNTLSHNRDDIWALPVCRGWWPKQQTNKRTKQRVRGRLGLKQHGSETDQWFFFCGMKRNSVTLQWRRQNAKWSGFGAVQKWLGLLVCRNVCNRQLLASPSSQQQQMRQVANENNNTLRPTVSDLPTVARPQSLAPRVESLPDRAVPSSWHEAQPK